MFQWRFLPVPVYNYAKRFCLLHLWIVKDIGTVEVLELLL